jgi:rRNA maturation RNase YbeY
MPVYIHEQQTRFHVEQKRIVKSWIKQIIDNHQKKTGDINIILCSDEELLKMNQEVLDHDTYTDIITFNYNHANIVSGDLFISIERIQENASKFAVSTEEELRRVMIHGVLHLIGFNDKKDNERLEMRRKENESLSLLEKMFHVKHD